MSRDERLVLQELSEGVSLVDVARKHFFSERTARRHLQNACLKLRVSNRAEAIKRATLMGFID